PGVERGIASGLASEPRWDGASVNHQPFVRLHCLNPTRSNHPRRPPQEAAVMPSTHSRTHAEPSFVAALAALGVAFSLAGGRVHAAAGGFSVGRSHGGGGFGFGYSTAASGERMDFQYDLIGPDNNTMAVDGQQSWRTIGRLEDEVKRTGKDVFWFAVEGHEY